MSVFHSYVNLPKGDDGDSRGSHVLFVVHDYSKEHDRWTLGNYRKQIGTKSIAKLGFNHEQSSFFEVA